MNARRRFGKALVIETQPRCGGYILGFKVHPPEKLEKGEEVTQCEERSDSHNALTIFTTFPLLNSCSPTGNQLPP